MKDSRYPEKDESDGCGGDSASGLTPVQAMEQCSNCANTLNRIANRFEGDEDAIKAIAFAKNGLLFIATRRCMEFQSFLDEMRRGLPPEKEEELKRRGIEL
jgi:hypothetical protein